MLGPAVNGLAIIIGALVGTFCIKNVPLRFENIIVNAIGITIIYIGITGAMVSGRIMLLILSMAIGAILGELIDIDKGMNKIGKWAENKLGAGDSNFSKGFVAASIFVCVGSMAIVGSLESGLTGNHDIIFAKSLIDGIMSIVFASQYGIGVLFASVAVFLYEGAIVISAAFAKDLLTMEIINEMSAAGSLLIAALGINFMGLKEIKIANMIPAIFLPWLFIAAENMIF